MMKLLEIFEKLLLSPNVASQKPIFEKYDKNVQGNTAWERGTVASSILTPFRDFPELSEAKSRTGVAVATGGNPNIAQISARESAIQALVEAVIKVSCVGGIPLAATDCLNFGNPEKPDQMGEFVEGIEGLRLACTELDVPIVSGNVSLYNESSGQSIPPSTIVAVFGRVDDPQIVPTLEFKPNQTLFFLGSRSDHLGGSEFLKICKKEDTRLPHVDFSSLLEWLPLLRTATQKQLISSAIPLLRGGILAAVSQGCFQGKCGANIRISESFSEKVPQFLFCEDMGVVLTTSHPEKLRKLFGDQLHELGKTKKVFHLEIHSHSQKIASEDLTHLYEKWENKLRNIF
jgi:phosphoribosylformylglycinamidine synthase